MSFAVKITAIFALLVASLAAQQDAEIEVNLSSQFLVLGEESLMTVEIRGAQVVDWPNSPSVSSLAIKRQQKSFLNINGRISEVFEYLVSGFQPGEFTIPPFQVRTRQGIARSTPIKIRISAVEDLITKGITIKPHVVPYLSGLFVEKDSPFLGETQRAEAKLYVPRAAPHLLRMSNGQVIEMEKSGLAAWRFAADHRPSGRLAYDGYQFLVYTYQSSFNALREGDLKIGPGTAQPIFERRTTARGRFFMQSEAIDVEFPARSLKVRPLPPGSPPGFAGAVGEFALEISASAQEIDFGETVTIEASITGTGNLDQFPGPELVAPANEWKQFEMISKPTGSERRSSSGEIEFSQVIRPLVKVEAIPPYRFSYFDPGAEKYRTLESKAMPLIVNQANLLPIPEASPLAPLAPLPQVTPIILGTKTSSFGTWWHLIPATITAWLAFQLLRDAYARKRLQSEPQRAFKRDLESVAAAENDRVVFYREACQLATRWQRDTAFPELEQTRDELCFRPDKGNETVPAEEKKRVLELLKTLAPALLVGLFLFQISPLQAQEPTPLETRDTLLAELESSPTREHLFNLSLAEKALERPGQASLWAHRFQAHGGDASDLLAALPGLRAKPKKEVTAWLSIFSKSTYLQVILAGFWACLIAFLLWKRYSSKSSRIIATACTVLGFGALFVGSIGYFFYPRGISFLPLAELSVITEETALRSQAFSGGTIRRGSLVGSLCQATVTRSDFCFIQLPGGLSGWVEKSAVQAIALPKQN